MEKQQPQQPVYSFKQLETYIALSEHITGSKPKEIELVPAFYNWYIQECQAQAEGLNLKTGFKDDVVAFVGIKLIKKPQIVRPQSPAIVTK